MLRTAAGPATDSNRGKNGSFLSGSARAEVFKTVSCEPWKKRIGQPVWHTYCRVPHQWRYKVPLQSVDGMPGPTLPKRPLGATGLQVPVLSFGASPLGGIYNKV